MNAILNFAVFSASMAAAAGILFLLSRITGKRFSASCRYAIWAIIVVRMCLPSVLFPTFLTVQTAAPQTVSEYTAEVDEPSSPSPSEQADRDPVGPAITPTSPAVTPAEPSEDPAPAEKTDAPAENPAPRTVDLAVLIPVVYLSVSAAILAVRLIGYNVSMRKMRRSLRDPDENTAAIYRRAAEEAGVKRAPALFVSDKVAGPLLCGFFNRKIILTESAVASGGLYNVLRHELIHHRRGDLFFKFFGTLCVSVNFLNPASYIAVSMMNREMEYSCDERVLDGASEEKRSEYGAAVLSVYKENRTGRLRSALTTGFFGGEKGIKNRFRRIMDSGKKKRGIIIVAIALLVCIVAGSVISFSAANKSEPGEVDPPPAAETGSAATDPETEEQTGSEPATETDAATETGTAPGTETASETETEAEPATEPATETERETDREPSYEGVTVEAPEQWLINRIKSDSYEWYEAIGLSKRYEPIFITKYYGTFGDAVAYMTDLNYDAYHCEEVDEDIAGYRFSYPDGRTVSVWSGGRFYNVRSAYENGVLSKEDVGKLAYIKSSGLWLKLENPKVRIDPPEEWLINRIKGDLFEKKREPGSEYPFFIVDYYGTYGGSAAFMAEGGGVGYSEAEIIEDIAGFRFHYYDGNTTLIWKNGEFYSVGEAYGLGILSKEDVANIAYIRWMDLGLKLETPVYKTSQPADTETAPPEPAVNDRFSGVCGDDLTYSFDEKTGTLTISGTGAMYDYGVGWGGHGDLSPFAQRTDILTLVLEEGVTTIGDDAFMECPNIRSLVFPSTLTFISAAAFSPLQVEHFELPEGMTALEPYFFWNWTHLKSLTLPSTLREFDPVGVGGCVNLESIGFRGENKYFKVVDGVVFSADMKKLICCPAGKKADVFVVPDSVTEIGKNAFSNSKIKEIVLPAGIRTIGEFAFTESAIEKVVVPGKVGKVAHGAFELCVNLKTVVLESGITVIEGHAFDQCSALTDVTFPDTLETIAECAFYCCTSLEGAVLPDGLKEFGVGVFEKTGLVSITLPKSVTVINAGTFRNCASLRSVVAEGVTEIKNEAFYGCGNLEEVKLGVPLSSVKKSVFKDCPKLKWD